MPKESKPVDKVAVGDDLPVNENSLVSFQKIQSSNSKQSAVMQSHVMHFNNGPGSSSTFVFNFGM